MPIMLLQGRGRETAGTVLQRLQHDVLHLGDLFRRRGAVGGFFAEHPGPHRRMAAKGRHVRYHAAPLQRVHVVREGLEIPVDPFDHRLQRHAFDMGKILQDAVAVLRHDLREV